MSSIRAAYRENVIRHRGLYLIPRATDLSDPNFAHIGQVRHDQQQRLLD